MAPEGFKRKLTAILSADVEGYSRLMGDDEEATVRTLTTYREVMTTLIQQHNGKVLDSPGDNLLAEFVSVVDAVQCAVAVQKEFQARNVEMPESRRMVFRIGINLGDVIEEEERIYGDGVNIAARLEGLAKPGGICISKTAFDHIESKLPYGYEFIGDQTVKNIAKPVGAYQVVMEPRVTVVGKPEDEKPAIVRRTPILIGAVAVLVLTFAVGIWQFYMRRPSVEPASIDKMAYPLPDKPSIAVLPFENISGDPEQDYIADGITDNIITGLSQVPKMFVISRNSVLTYKGKPVNVRQVSEELGVRYVLEGSVQQAADRLRINAQLIDAVKGHHLWAKSYNRELKDLFALQDEITLKIITEMAVKLTVGEAARIYAKGTDNLDAYFKAWKAQMNFLRFTKDDNHLAKQMAKEIIDLDPNYPDGYIILGWAHWADAVYGWSKSPKESLVWAEELARKVLELDDSQYQGHIILGRIYQMRGQWDKFIAENEHAVSISPDPETSYHLADALNSSGRPEESIALFKKAIRLDPIPMAWVIWSLGSAYFDSGRYEDALTEFKRLLDRSEKGEFNPEFAHRLLAATYVMLGREKEARKHAVEVIRINPKFTLKGYAKTQNYKNKADSDRWIVALRKAGLPD
jgi:adenylate cyclase